MALVNTSFLVPQGFINPAVFPGETVPQVLTRIQSRLDEGYVKTSALAADQIDNAVTAYVYWKVFQSILTDIATNPMSSASADQGSYAYTQAQIDWLSEQVRAYQAEYNAYFTSDLPRSPIQQVVSSSVQNTLRF
jgi:hypothetical protein